MGYHQVVLVDKKLVDSIGPALSGRAWSTKMAKLNEGALGSKAKAALQAAYYSQL